MDSLAKDKEIKKLAYELNIWHAHRMREAIGNLSWRGHILHDLNYTISSRSCLRVCSGCSGQNVQMCNITGKEKHHILD